ncbi:hypothetical protein CR513_20906, partial [Mucuna pruriens]
MALMQRILTRLLLLQQQRKFRIFLIRLIQGLAIFTAGYILNMSPTKRLRGIALEESCIDIHCDLDMCLSNLEGSLDDKGKHSTSGYRLYNPRNNKIVISKYIMIDEFKSWNRDTNTRKRLTKMLVDLNDTDALQQLPLKWIPQRLQDCEMVPNSVVTSKGELVHFALFSYLEQVCFTKAMQDPRWFDAMEEELKLIEKNQTWGLVSLSSHKRSIVVKIVGKGFLQRDEMDYGDPLDEVYVAQLDLAFSVGMISRLMDKPRTPHLLVAKRILCYVKEMLDCGSLFPNRRDKAKVKNNWLCLYIWENTNLLLFKERIYGGLILMKDRVCDRFYECL